MEKFYQQYQNLMQQQQQTNNQSDIVDLSYQRNLYSEASAEKKRITERLNGFNPRENNAWKEISRRFGASIKHPELLSIATVLANYANVRLDRDAKRRKTVLIKWFQENWATVSPYLDYVVLEDSPQIQH
ncbi:hypothetical protein GPJ56_003900 [Histomonas meleagridis]|uniref:uncharacterized protein n=1 Tax=Histomonas meleagridis TaxID=135588 RepID=UPI003559CF82|nr:hypothetical protein GPJ56_003900 [Histomonas meleagridis]KAH0797558.1 hypothetical protein GO595_009661 [Histomonas meleagridis]